MNHFHLPDAYKYEGVHVDVANHELAESDLGIDVANLVAVHYREESKHRFRWRAELPDLPEKTESQKGKTNEKWKYSYHCSHNNRKCLIHRTVYKGILRCTLNITRERYPSKHATKPKKKLCGCHIFYLAHDFQKSSDDE